MNKDFNFCLNSPREIPPLPPIFLPAPIKSKALHVTYDHGQLASATVKVQIPHVQHQRRHAVEEDKDSEGDKELGRGGEVAHEVGLDPCVVT